MGKRRVGALATDAIASAAIGSQPELLVVDHHELLVSRAGGAGCRERLGRVEVAAARAAAALGEQPELLVADSRPPPSPPSW